ncbi:hypothetical protein HMPREF9370_1894 [Neisseria wadsworthii 9715]|uniref:Uncharacterized protein n=1 Tax=Neisseria wadsworthii 9715 TaxID=1030841 RepID=G4CS34_9NEIS|nr:hypothetical protein HMPREF9370_1894 [Neisseria wadsworthii 9715]
MFLHGFIQKQIKITLDYTLLLGGVGKTYACLKMNIEFSQLIIILNYI